MNKKLTSKISALVSEFVGAKTGTYGKLTNLCDELIAGGYTDLRGYSAPVGKDADRTFYDSLLKAIVAGYSAEVRALLAMETSAVPDGLKEERRKWNMRKGADVADIRNAMTKRLASAKAAGEGEAETPATFEAKHLERLLALLKQAKKYQPQGEVRYSLNKYINLIGDCIAELSKK